MNQYVVVYENYTVVNSLNMLSMDCEISPGCPVPTGLLFIDVTG